METPQKVCSSDANCTLATVCALAISLLGCDEYFGSGRWISIVAVCQLLCRRTITSIVPKFDPIEPYCRGILYWSTSANIVVSFTTVGLSCLHCAHLVSEFLKC